MTKEPLTNGQAAVLLAKEWSRALQESAPGPDHQVDELANSKVKSIRYALLTQILGKIASPGRSVMAIQLGDGSEGAWDARSFAKDVIVPWEFENKHFLGGSGDPYVSKPLRRSWLGDQQTSVRDKEDWQKLENFLRPLDTAKPVELIEAFRRVLASFARKLANESFGYLIPGRIDQHRLEYIVFEFLQESSGGLRPLAVATALFKTIGRGFNLFSEIRSQGVNEADVSKGVPGDIMCYNESGSICLAVEVKGIELTLTHVEETTEKAKRSKEEISNLIFAVPNVQEKDFDKIQDRIYHRWTENLNLYVVSILNLVATTLILLDEQWRIFFLREIGNQLDERRDQVARRRWDDLLKEIHNR